MLSVSEAPSGSNPVIPRASGKQAAAVSTKESEKAHGFTCMIRVCT